MKPIIRLFFVVIILTAAGCSLMEPQPQLIIPTPPAMEVTPALLIANNAGVLVTDPVSDVVPTVDPAVESLITEVSQQQVMAYIRQLESFGTRNAFSDTQSETFGAARPGAGFSMSSCASAMAA